MQPINRRSLLAGATATGVALAGGDGRAQALAAAGGPDVYELRTYRLVHGSMKSGWTLTFKMPSFRLRAVQVAGRSGYSPW